MLLQRLPHPFVPYRPAAEGQHAGLWPVQQRERHLLLGGAEGGLAVLGEHALDRLAQPLLDHAVDVRMRGAEELGQAAGGRRLARAHEADAHERALRGRSPAGYPRRHAIRSS